MPPVPSCGEWLVPRSAGGRGVAGSEPGIPQLSQQHRAFWNLTVRMGKVHRAGPRTHSLLPGLGGAGVDKIPSSSQDTDQQGQIAASALLPKGLLAGVSPE